MVNPSPIKYRTIAAARPSSRRLRPVSLASGAIHRRAFSLVEVLVVMTLLSIIVLALMQVFTTTQRAFRAGVTQTDVLEGSRAAVDLISSDLRSMTASGGYSNAVTGPVNFFALDNNYYGLPSLGYWPLIQSLPGTGTHRTNLLDYFYLLSRQNMKWIGVGYVVNYTNTASLYPLYRFYAETNISASPQGMFNGFIATINTGQWTNLSHVLDGVVHLAVRAYDPNGYHLTNSTQYAGGAWVTNKNVWFSLPVWGETGFYFYSNTLPAAVELQLGVIEDRALQRAESLPNYSPAAQPNDRRTAYLQGLSGNVHLFRQRVTIPNLDPTAYQ